MQVEVYMRGRCDLPAYMEHAAEFLTTGNRRLTDQSVVIFSSVSGTTPEMVEAITRVRQIGAQVFGFIDREDAPLVELCDWCISYPQTLWLFLR